MENQNQTNPAPSGLAGNVNAAESLRQSGLLRRFATVLVLVLMFLAITGVKRADAYAYWTSGQPGTVGINRITGNHNVQVPCSTSCPQVRLLDNGTQVGRSLATTGAQTVASIYQLQRWNGSAWVIVTSQTNIKTIPAGYSSVSMPRFEAMPNSGPGYYKVVRGLNWATSTGVVLGSFAADMNQASDYACDTLYPCVVGSGWVWLGSSGMVYVG